MACTSIKFAILGALGDSREIVHGNPLLNQQEVLEALSKYPDHLTIAVVRNPFDRLVSCYVQKMFTDRCKKDGFEDIGCWREMPFGEFVKVVENDPMANIHFAPQWDLIGRQNPDRFIRFEKLEEGWEFLRGLDWELGPLPHLNSTVRDPYHNYYDLESRQRAEAIYKEDCDNLGYEF